MLACLRVAVGRGGADARVREWPRGISPRGSLRTVREPLDSYGSHHPVGLPASHSRNAPSHFWLTMRECRMMQPLCSTGITPLHHYYGLLGPCATPRYSGPRGVLRLCRLPLHRDDRFTRSVRKPDTRSRRLYTGCRLAHKEVLSSLILRESTALSFDIIAKLTIRHRSVCFRSSPCILSAGIFIPTFPSTLNTKALYPSILR